MDILQCSGLSTLYSELQQPAGALAVADNIVIDRDNLISPRRGLANYGTVHPALLKQTFLYQNALLNHYTTTIEFDSDGNGTWVAFDGSYTELETGLRIKSQESNGNLYFTTSEGIKKISAMSSAEFTSNAGYITQAGGIQALDVTGQLVSTSTGFLTGQSTVAYRIAWGYVDVNNNLIIGAVSSRLVVNNNSQNIQTSSVIINGSLTVGQYFILNVFDGTNTTSYTVWFSTSSADIQPNGSDTINTTFIRANIPTSGTSAIANAIANAVSDITSFTINTSVTGSTILFSPEFSLGTSNVVNGIAGTTNYTLNNNIVSSATNANVNLTFTVPQGINTNYFYQIYRTPVLQIVNGQTLNSIDPGDEEQLINESFYVSGTTITYLDSVPESLRAAGAFLYTNAQTGDTGAGGIRGIALNNYIPPIAKDITLFRNSMFYANITTVHTLNIDLLAVSNFTSGTSILTISNANIAREYTFQGAEEVTTITTDSKANTTTGGYILLYSASNERAYYIWFDKTGSDTDPSIVGKIGVRVDISGATTATDISALITSTFSNITDFNIIDNMGSVTITNIKNGAVTHASIVGLSGLWAASGSGGIGTDPSINGVLLSNLGSIGQSIDETARSLVSIINQDTLSPVYADYLSGPADLPGQISLRNRDLVNTPFLLAVNQSIMQNDFSPVLPLIKTITSIASGTNIITSVAHGFISGNTVYVYGTDSTPALLGLYTVTVIDADTFTLNGTTITVSGTTGKVFLTSAISSNNNYPNRVYFSKFSQPEAVPLLNFLEIGPKNKEIRRIIALRNNLFVLKDDGVYMITGSSASSGFSSQLISSSTQILASDSAVVLNNQIFVLTTQGVVAISESGGDAIKSRKIEGIIKGITNSRYANYKSIAFGVSYETDRAYTLWLPTLTSDSVATQGFRYNTITDTWTRVIKSATCGIVNTSNDKMYIGAGDVNYLLQERKMGDRTDFCDAQFDISLNANGVSGTTFQISTSTNVVAGDVLVQTQYITIPIFNRLLRKLDLDTGTHSHNYSSTLKMSQGNNIQNSLIALDTKLVSDMPGYSSVSFSSSDFATIQVDYNLMIDNLNSANGTNYKDYAHSIGTTDYEVLILNVGTNNNVTVNLASLFIEGPVIQYKGFTKKIVWQPVFFGKVSVFKQIREGSVLFNNNNYTNAILSYSTDLNGYFEDIPIFGQGVGSWGEFDFGSIDFGGGGNDAPERTFLPREKQRCRYVNVKFTHTNSRENFSILGITLEERDFSTKAYR